MKLKIVPLVGEGYVGSEVCYEECVTDDGENVEQKCWRVKRGIRRGARKMTDNKSNHSIRARLRWGNFAEEFHPWTVENLIEGVMASIAPEWSWAEQIRRVYATKITVTVEGAIWWVIYLQQIERRPVGWFRKSHHISANSNCVIVSRKRRKNRSRFETVVLCTRKPDGLQQRRNLVHFLLDESRSSGDTLAIDDG